MANEKILNTRISLKVDTLKNWSESTLPLKKGEVAFATVAATAGNGLSEPVVMMKIGEDGVKTFKDIEWNFYAKASDVIASAKSEDALRTFINGVIADAGIATNEAMEALAGRVTTTEGAIATLNGNDETAGSVAKAIKDAIKALNLDTTYVKIDDISAERTKLAGISAEAKKVEASEINGNIKIDGIETVVYTHPEKHTIDDVAGLQDALDGKQAVGDYATKTEAQGYANAKDEAIAAAKKAGDDAQAEVDNLEIFVGQLPEGATATTVVGYIDAKTANIASDETVSAIDNRVKAIEDDYLVEADKTELSNAIIAEKERAEGVEAGLQTQINTIMNNPDAEGAINSINEFTQYVADHGTIADGFRTDIDKNKEDIAELDKAISEHEELAAETYETKTDAGNKLTEAKGYTDTAKSAVIGTADDASTADTIKGAKKYAEEKASAAETAAKGHADGLNTAMNARVEALEAIDHSHTFVESELNKIADGDVAKWNAAEQNAKDYADDQIEALGTMSKETATDYVKKSEATGYDDILTKTEAQGAYQAKGEYYTKTEANIEFTNSTEVDGQIDAKITALDLANTYQAKGDYATAEQGGKADTALQEITTTENGGLKVTNKNQIDIDENVVFVFDCGDSGVTA